MNIEFLYDKKTKYEYQSWLKVYADVETKTYLNVELTPDAITIIPRQEITKTGEYEVENPEHKKWEADIRFSIAFIEEPEPYKTITKSFNDKKTQTLSPIVYKSGRLCNLDYQSTDQIERIVSELCKKHHITDIIEILRNHYGIFTEAVYLELLEKLRSYFIRLFNSYKDRGYSDEDARNAAAATIKKYKQIIDNNRSKFKSMNLDDVFDKI